MKGKLMRRLLQVAGVLCGACSLVVTTGYGAGVAARPSAHESPRISTVGPVADFDGDGYGDLAIGAPGDSVGSHPGAGAVNVLYGSSTGLAAAGNQLWSQDSTGVAGVAESGDNFGDTTAVGDFNHDGYTDLAVGVPKEGVGSVKAAGAVNVLYGSPSGLTSTGNQVWDEAVAGVLGTPNTNDQFGFSLATGDFNNDGYADLAVGVPDERSPAGGGQAGATPGSRPTCCLGTHPGAVSVLYGSAAGLTATGNQLIRGDQSDANLGTALAAGNFNAAEGTDLAAGEPFASNGSLPNAGEVVWMAGTPSGLGGLNVVPINDAQDGAYCGWSLAALNADDDPTGYADLAFGCPEETRSHDYQGVVHVHYGSATGLGSSGRLITGPNPSASAAFGTSLAAADLGKDATGHDDLVIGAPGWQLNATINVGEVVVDYLGTGGGTFQVLRQGLDGTMGTGELGDIFGSAVATGDFDGDGWGDLAVGVPGESLGSVEDAGGVNVFYGTTSGVTAARNRFWSQNSAGIRGTAEKNDVLGEAVGGRGGEMSATTFYDIA